MPTPRSRTATRPLFAALGALVLLTGLLPMAAISHVNAAGPNVNLTALDAAYTQSFDTLPAIDAAQWSNDVTIPGWLHARTGTGLTITATNGGTPAGGLYSFGTGTSTDRAIGSVGSGNAAVGNLYWGVRLFNGTGSTITSLDVAYVGEQWRNSAAVAQTVSFSYLIQTEPITGTLAQFQASGFAVPALDFTSPVTGGTASALDGNAAANRIARSATISGLSIPDGSEIMLRWSDPNHAGDDHGLSIDDFSVTPHAEPPPTTLSINDVSMNEGNAGTTAFSFTVSLSTPAPAGGVTFDIATANDSATEPSDYTAKSLTSQTIAAGSSTYDFTVLVNGDTSFESNEQFSVNISNVTGATVADGHGSGSIQNDDVQPPAEKFIHDVQGNGATSPIAGATVTVQGIVVDDFQTTGTGQLAGFFLQEEDGDVDADPMTSEGVFVFCGGCATPVAEGDQVRVTGVVSEFFGLTEITANTAGSVLVTSSANTVTAASIDLPVVGDVDDYYEAREGMKVAFADTLTVSEYFELARFGQIILYEGGRPDQFTENSAPSVAGLSAHLDDLARRKVILDDTDNTQQGFLTLPNGQQFVYHPRANGGFSVGTQGVDFFRGGDTVANLTGVLQWGFTGTGANTWRIRPTAANPVTFTPVNARPATPPEVDGAIKAVGMNLLNYFTTIDTTSSNSTGPCGPSLSLDCRGADSVAELNRQRERASIVICDLNADVYGFMELENSASATITDLLGAVNTRCGGAHPYSFVDTGGTLGTDAIRVQLIYRTGILSAVGAALWDLDPIHNRPPTAQTFDVVDPSNVAFGRRFTVIANHFKSKGCDGAATGTDADAGDGQSCYNGRRTAQAARLLTWIDGTVVPAAGDPDILLVGDFNSYAKEDPIATIQAGGYTDLAATLDPGSYSYLFDGQLGHLDYGFASASLAPQVTGVGNWHINADEVPLFDYNDEILDSPGEAAFEEKPDGAALVPPRVVFQPGTPYRASDHDPVVVGLFSTTLPNLTLTKTADHASVEAGSQIGFTVTASNGASAGTALGVVIDDPLPAGTGVDWSIESGPGNCSITGSAPSQTLHCTAVDLAADSSESVHVVSATTSASCKSYTNTASLTSTDAPTLTADATTTVQCADLTVTRMADAAAVDAGSQIGFTITVSNSSAPGTATAHGVVISESLPAGTDVDWSIDSGPANCSIVGSPPNQVLDCTAVDLGPGENETVHVVSGTSFASCQTYVLGSASTTVQCSDLTLTKRADAETVDAGAQIGFTVTASNSSADGTGTARGVVIDDPLPAGPGIDWSIASGPADCSITGSAPAQTLHCTAVDLAPRSSEAVHVVSATGTGSAGTYLNIATLTSTNAPSSTARASTTVVNIAPTATVIGGQCGPGRAAAGSITINVTDMNGDPLTFTLASNSNPSLVPTANVVIDGSDPTFTIGITATDKKSGLATLTFHVSDGDAIVPVVVTVNVGTNANQILTGSDGIDVIFGLQGQDTINGLGGNDLLCGGLGDDTISGGAGDDAIAGAEGDDSLDGGLGNDALRGENGSDSLTGGAGADAFSGGQGIDAALDFDAGQGDTKDGSIP